MARARMPTWAANPAPPTPALPHVILRVGSALSSAILILHAIAITNATKLLPYVIFASLQEVNIFLIKANQEEAYFEFSCKSVKFMIFSIKFELPSRDTSSGPSFDLSRKNKKFLLFHEKSIFSVSPGSTATEISVSSQPVHVALIRVERILNVKSSTLMRRRRPVGVGAKTRRTTQFLSPRWTAYPTRSTARPTQTVMVGGANPTGVYVVGC